MLKCTKTIAAEAEPLSREHLNLHVVWQHRQLLQTKPLHCTGKPGGVTGAASCTAGWQQYFCLSQELQLGVIPLGEFGSKISVLSLAIMLFKLLPSKDLVLEKNKNFILLHSVLKRNGGFFSYLYILHMVIVYSICNYCIKVDEQTKPAFSRNSYSSQLSVLILRISFTVYLAVKSVIHA